MWRGLSKGQNAAPAKVLIKNIFWIDRRDHLARPGGE
jgi:hypothetical protein